MQTHVVETTVYTLEELKAMHPEAYDKAIQNTLTWANEWPHLNTDLTEQLTESITYYGEPVVTGGTVTEWGHYRGELKFEYEIDLVALLRKEKLAAKYRSLYNFLTSPELGVSSTVNGKTERRYRDSYPVDNSIFDDLYGEIDYLYGNYNNATPDEARHKRLCGQVALLESSVQEWVQHVGRELWRMIGAQIDYWYSDEFAVEEAEAQELEYTEEGELYH